MSELISLCGLGVGGSARVAEVAGERAMRRRLMDMGLIPGTRVTCVAASPAGGPSADLIRGAVVALRERDAAGIRVDPAAAFCPASAGEEPRWA